MGLIDNQNRDNLIAGNHKLVTADVLIEDGQNVVRGELMGQIALSEKFVTSLPTASDGSEIPRAIMITDVDAFGQDVRAGVYLSGEFSESEIVFNGNITDIVRGLLGIKGIFLKPSLDLGIFNPFTLDQVSGLAFNGDTRIFDSLTFNGGDISIWGDNHSSGNDLPQPLIAKQPLYEASSPDLNGNPGIRFNGLTDFFNHTGALKDIDNRTVFFVSKVKAGSATSGAFYGYNNGKDFTHYNSIPTENLRHFNGATFPVVIQADVRTFPMFLLTMTFSDTQCVTWQNLVKKTTTVNTPLGITNSYYVGAERVNFDTRFWEGIMGHHVIYQGVKTESEIGTIQNHIINGWGVV